MWPEQERRHLDDDISKSILFDENGYIFIRISVKFVS